MPRHKEDSALEKRIQRLMERFPERGDVIRALNESSAPFKDLIADHHDVSEELAKMPRADQAGDPAKLEELKRRQSELEEELLLLMEAHQRV